MFDALARRFRRLAPTVDFCALRAVQQSCERLQVRQGVDQPLHRRRDDGVMITVIHRGGTGYAATADCSDAGLRAALARAVAWADTTRGKLALDPGAERLPALRGRYAGAGSGWPAGARRQLMETLREEAAACRIDDRIVDWSAGARLTESSQLYLSTDGAELEQEFRYFEPTLSVTAHAAGQTQTRSFGGFGRQGGPELIAACGLLGAGRRTAIEALELLAAPECPSGVMDLLLLPAQMMLQIHESIGHPLELDRILGDERNFAGTSFVTAEMFGSYRYGSELLNVSFDPTLSEELASYRWDDDGLPAQKVLLIENGILKRPLGGAVSQARAGVEGVANGRACSWNRPVIDRMANLNIEPGESSLEQMIGAIDYGVMMDSNHSWSIDDSRNKFQFGCEQGWLIENGRISHLVKNPGYRGVSATFWRSLAQVGARASFQVLGTGDCGKGEPNQIIHVGHAAPACLFRGVQVFGGEGA